MILLVLVMCIMSFGMLVACTPDDDDDNDDDTIASIVTINYIVDEEVYRASTYRIGDFFRLPQEPGKINHYFVGWYLDEDFTEKFKGEGDVIACTDEVLNVYAKFVECNIIVNYYADGEEYTIRHYAYGFDFRYPLDPTKPEYKFLGWYLDEQFTTKFDEKVHIKEDTTELNVYAKFEYIAQKNLEFTLSTDGTYYTVTGFKQDSDGSYTTYDDMVIPSEYKGLPVKAIADNAFKDMARSLVQTVVIQEGVESIGSKAFYGANGIRHIELPSTITDIGNEAFEGCYRLISVFDKTNLNLEIGSLDNGGVGYFAKDIYSDESQAGKFTEDEEFVFYELPNATKDMYLVDYAGRYVETLTLPSQYGYKIQSGAFIHHSFENLVIKSNVAEIGDFAFYNIYKLQTVTYAKQGLYSGLQYIGDSAFADCRSLQSIDISADITNIKDNVFQDCDKLKKINFDRYISDWRHFATGWASDVSNNCEIQCRDGIVDKYGESFECPAGTSGIEYKYYEYDETYRVVGMGTANTNSIVIPRRYNGCLVTSIDENAFKGNKEITSIVIPNSITYINNNSFADCTNLTYVTLPDGLESIGNNAFDNADITSLVIPDSVTSIGWYAFAHNRNMVSAKLPSSLEVMSHSILYNCNKLTDVVIPEGVTNIGDNAFTGTALKQITIPKSVTSIGNSAFSGCNKLTSIRYNGTTSEWKAIEKDVWSQYAYEYGVIYCTDDKMSYKENIIQDIVELNGMTYSFTVGERDYQGYKLVSVTDKTLKEVVVPDMCANFPVIAVGGEVFKDNACLQNITLSANLKYIGESAFENCLGLISISIPNKMSDIGDYAFRGCYRLIEVFNDSYMSFSQGYEDDGCIAKYAKNVYGRGNGGGTSKLHIDGDYIFYVDETESYLVDYKGTDTILTLPENGGVAYGIYKYVFKDNNSLTNVVIPNVVTSIGEYAFENCEGITEITLGNGLVEIGEQAFNACGGLNKVHVSDVEAWFNIQFADAYANPLTYANGMYTDGVLVENITVNSNEIKQFALYNYDCLKSITLSDSVNSIGAQAFYDCNSLESVTLGSGLASISNQAFYRCDKLQTVEFNEGLESIGNSVFAECISLTSVALPDSLTSLGKGVFAGCTAIESVTIGSGLEKISEHAFYNNASLNNLVIPANVQEIEGYAFFGCTTLDNITFNEGLIIIRPWAFSKCTSLTSVVFPNSLKNIWNNAFRDCTSLANVTFGNSLEVIDATVFENCAIESIDLPVSIKSIKHTAFGRTITTINYAGTMAEWNAVVKDVDWDIYMPVGKVVCTDGEITVGQGITEEV